MKLKILVLVFMTLFLTGCGTFLHTNRTFIESMEDEGDFWFRPNQDFNVVAGDTGRVRLTRNEIRRRTPMSQRQRRDYLHDMAIEEELSSLEGAQSPRFYNHYMAYKDKLKTTSERIYFLRLRNIEDRNEYLYSKGLYEFAPLGASDSGQAVGNREIIVGMNKDAVKRSWGHPSRIDVAGNPRFENERWTFFTNGRMKQVFFEQGKVQGWVQD